jgi:hypothetical protein
MERVITVLMKIKPWLWYILCMAVLLFVFSRLTWISSDQKFLVLFSLITVLKFFTLYKTIKSKNVVIIVVDIIFSIIIFYCMYIFLQRFFT